MGKFYRRQLHIVQTRKPPKFICNSWVNIILMRWASISIRIKLLYIIEFQIINVTLSQPLLELVRKRLCRRVNIYSVYQYDAKYASRTKLFPFI